MTTIGRLLTRLLGAGALLFSFFWVAWTSIAVEPDAPRSSAHTAALAVTGYLGAAVLAVGGGYGIAGKARRAISRSAAAVGVLLWIAWLVVVAH